MKSNPNPAVVGADDIDYPSACHRWARVSCDNYPHRNAALRVLAAAIDLAGDTEFADALSEIRAEYEFLDKLADAMPDTERYLDTNMRDALAQSGTHPDTAERSRYAGKAYAYADALRVLDIARGL